MSLRLKNAKFFVNKPNKKIPKNHKESKANNFILSSAKTCCCFA